MSDNYRQETAVATTPCPQCGGVVWYGDLLSSSDEQESDHRGLFLSCSTCGWDIEQRLDDTAEELPGEFFDALWHLAGWSKDGRYVNCCEGPVVEDGWGNHP